MSRITIYHNPKCKTSRDVLEKIRANGIEPNVVLYLQNPPTEPELRSLIKSTGASVRHVLRQKGTPYEELDLGNAKWTEDELIATIIQHPILLNRPIVSNGKIARLCRPIETVLDVLK
ncbi:MAG: Arsenate reductase [Pseudomonadota bacterium]|jgi:arsenate reductase